MVCRILFTTAALFWLPGMALAQVQADPGETELGEVIVTGEKAGRTLKETASSVFIVSARRIEQENTQTIQDIYNRTANVSETYGASGFTIRGINNRGVSSGGAADTATVYLDGAPIPRDALYGGPTNLWDIGQVEILRGPQSTIQGLNSLAGAVVITSREPSTARWTGDARVLWTDQQDRTFSAAVGGPLIQDELGLRLSAERRDDRGLIRNVTRGGYDDAMQSWSLRGKLKWTPAALQGLEAVLTYNRSRRDGGYLFDYVNIGVPDFYRNRISTADAQNLGKVDADLAALQVSYPVAERLRISSVTSWNKVGVHSLADGDFGPQKEELIDNRSRFRTFTQEVRLNYAGERLSGLLGVWYYRRTGLTEANSQINVPTPVPTIVSLLRAGGLPAATATAVANTYDAALPNIPVDYSSEQPMRVETLAAFGDGAFKLTSRLSLIGGFRYDHETNSSASETVARFTGILPNPGAFAPAGTPLNQAVAAINQGVLGLVAQANAPYAESRRSFDAFLPKGGIKMEWTPDLVTAFTVQRAYRSGGAVQNPARAILVAYDPERSWNYEASLRSVWLDRRLTVNANAFYIDWRDQQVNVFRGLNSYDYNTVNAGRSHLYGFEIEAEARLSPALDVYGSAGAVRTRFDEFSLPAGTTTNVELSGSEFAYAPRWTLAAGVNYRFGRGFVANLNANYRSRVFGDVGVDQAQMRLPGRTVVNARLAYETGPWTLSIYGRNVLDETYKQYDRRDGVGILGDPQTFGVGLEAHW